MTVSEGLPPCPKCGRHPRVDQSLLSPFYFIVCDAEPDDHYFDVFDVFKLDAENRWRALCARVAELEAKS